MKTCKNCKALTTKGCSLDYKTEIKTVERHGTFVYNYVPAEECPKPTTNEEYVEWIKVRK